MDDLENVPRKWSGSNFTKALVSLRFGGTSHASGKNREGTSFPFSSRRKTVKLARKPNSSVPYTKTSLTQFVLISFTSRVISSRRLYLRLSATTDNSKPVAF